MLASQPLNQLGLRFRLPQHLADLKRIVAPVSNPKEYIYESTIAPSRKRILPWQKIYRLNLSELICAFANAKGPIISTFTTILLRCW
jgi:hypothetical protein